MAQVVRAMPLTAEAFRPYGDVITLPEAPADPARSQLFRGVGELSFTGGSAGLDLLYTAVKPLELAMMERHRNSSQAFLPLRPVPFVVAVAPPTPDDVAEPVAPQAIVAFISDGRQGVNFRAGVWHHPLLPVGDALVTAIVHRRHDDGLDAQVVPVADGGAVIQL